VNRSQLIVELQNAMVKKGYDPFPRREVVDYLDSFIEIVQTSVKKGEPVTLTNFCKFARKDVAAKPKRQVRNPATGETIWAKPKPASKAVRITPLKGFKDFVGTAKKRLS
jgi:nucleoid DNA-binding protein